MRYECACGRIGVVVPLLHRGDRVWVDGAVIVWKKDDKALIEMSYSGPPPQECIGCRIERIRQNDQRRADEKEAKRAQKEEKRRTRKRWWHRK